MKHIKAEHAIQRTPNRQSPNELQMKKKPTTTTTIIKKTKQEKIVKSKELRAKWIILLLFIELSTMLKYTKWQQATNFLDFLSINNKTDRIMRAFTCAMQSNPMDKQRVAHICLCFFVFGFFFSHFFSFGSIHVHCFHNASIVILNDRQILYTSMFITEPQRQNKFRSSTHTHTQRQKSQAKV